MRKYLGQYEFSRMWRTKCEATRTRGRKQSVQAIKTDPTLSGSRNITKLGGGFNHHQIWMAFYFLYSDAARWLALRLASVFIVLSCKYMTALRNNPNEQSDREGTQAQQSWK